MQRVLVSAPDARWTIDEMVAEGDTVAVRGVLTGTNTGPIGNNPATGKKVTMLFCSFYWFRDGK